MIYVRELEILRRGIVKILPPIWPFNMFFGHFIILSRKFIQKGGEVFHPPIGRGTGLALSTPLVLKWSDNGSSPPYFDYIQLLWSFYGRRNCKVYAIRIDTLHALSGIRFPGTSLYIYRLLFFIFTANGFAQVSRFPQLYDSRARLDFIFAPEFESRISREFIEF